MPHTFARAVLTSVIAFGTLILSAGAAIPDNFDQGRYQYPYGGEPIILPNVPHDAHTVVIIREAPQLLTPADLHFSVDDENGVTVVRGPLVQ